MHGGSRKWCSGGLATFGSSAAEDRVHPTIAVGRQIGDNAFDLADEVLIRLRAATDKLPLRVLRALGEVRAGDDDDVRDGLRRELPAVDPSKRNVPLWGSAYVTEYVSAF